MAGDHEAAIGRLREIAERGFEELTESVDEVPMAADEPVDGTAEVSDEAVSEGADVEPDTEAVRIAEAVLFASPDPVTETRLKQQLPEGTDVAAVLQQLARHYEGRGINLVKVAGKWAFRTAEDLGYLLEKYATEQRRLSKAALETLAIIAYHQPVTRAEIEEVRGVATSKGTLDVLMETRWVRPRGRRRAPGRPVTYGTTDEFMSHFGLESLGDLPGLADLKASGLLRADLPPDFAMPGPKEIAALMPDELPLEDDADAEDEAERADECDDDVEDPEGLIEEQAAHSQNG